jgi:uncharacterized RDD family membrane protein YckC
MTMAASTAECLVCKRPLAPGLFCLFCGTFVLDPRGTVKMASRGMRLASWLVNLILMVLTLYIGWIIWWFIVAPRGQNPGKAILGLRVIRTDGRAVDTGTMLVRGLVGFAFGLFVIVQLADDLWLLWDKDAQTLHDKVASTVVVAARGSEHVVEQGSVGSGREGLAAVPAPFAPPVTMPPAQVSAQVGSTPAAATASSAADDLVRLVELKDKGILTEDEYQEKRKAIVDRM